MQQDVGSLQLADHLLGVGDEVGRDIAAVELHALDHVEFGLQGFRLFDRDHPFVADLLHRLGDHLADFAIAIGRDRADLGNLCIGGNLLRALLQVFDDGLDAHVDAAPQIHRVHARGDRLDAFAHDRSGEHSRRCGAVAGGIAGLGRDLLDQLRAHILELVGELDLLGDGHAILGDARRAV